MKAVYRYDLELTDRQEIELPANALLLHIARQTRTPHALSLWVAVDPENVLETRGIALTGTGHSEIEDDFVYISTYQEPSGFVWHFWDAGVVL